MDPGLSRSDRAGDYEPAEFSRGFSESTGVAVTVGLAFVVLAFVELSHDRLVVVVAADRSLELADAAAE